MHHETPPQPCEPVFEPPPRLEGRVERRLTGRAALRTLAAHEFRDNALTLGFEPGSVRVVKVGGAVAAAFGLKAGMLQRGDDDLGTQLIDAGAACAASGTVVNFEAALRTASAACVLLRGVLLPTRGGAEAVLSWKQVLDGDASARLRAELQAAITVPAEPRRDPFADTPLPCRADSRAA